MYMSKTITISVDEKIDRQFREYARSKYGKRKGHLRKAYEEAFGLLLNNGEQERIRSEALEMLHKGVKVKRYWKFNRDEAHER